jgi:hypothetical protein
MASRRVKDHRGRYCTVSWRWGEALRALGAGKRLGLAVWLIACVLMLWFSFQAFRLSGTLPQGARSHPLRVMWPPALVSLLGLASWVQTLLQTAPAIAEDRLRKNRCPSCEYTLAGLSPDPDGCRTCPECGAAWRTGALGKYHE